MTLAQQISLNTRQLGWAPVPAFFWLGIMVPLTLCFPWACGETCGTSVQAGTDRGLKKREGLVFSRKRLSKDVQMTVHYPYAIYIAHYCQWHSI